MNLLNLWTATGQFLLFSNTKVNCGNIMKNALSFVSFVTLPHDTIKLKLDLRRLSTT